MDAARDALLGRFEWIDGHANVWAVFRDADALRSVVTGLAEPCRDAGISAVIGIEARGFLLGAAVAVDLGVGFVPVRKGGTLFPGPKSRLRTAADYRGNRADLAVQRSAITSGDRLLMVDDWIETGSQALAVRQLVEDCGGELVALSVLVDETEREIQAKLPPIHALVRSSDLPPDEG